MGEGRGRRCDIHEATWGEGKGILVMGWRDQLFVRQGEKGRDTTGGKRDS